MGDSEVGYGKQHTGTQHINNVRNGMFETNTEVIPVSNTRKPHCVLSTT